MKAMSDEDRKIIDICTLVGFNQERTFYRAFRAETGMTPHEYRQRYKRKSPTQKSAPTLIK